MTRNIVETIVLPSDPAECRALLEKLLNAEDEAAAWKEVHAKYAGDLVVIEGE